MRLEWVCSIALVAAVGGCTVVSTTDAGRTPDSPSLFDAGRDAPPTLCTGALDCDDGFACTTDACAFGGVCEHMAFDTLCASGERCDVARGCVTGAMTCRVGTADCMVGRTYCDGLWTCIADVCYLDMARDCDDGNACTIDSCDDSLGGGAGGCAYDTAAGCDGGVILGDGGVAMCDPFVPATGYAGSYLLLPTPSSGCGGTAPSYRAMNLAFSVAAGTLSVAVTPGLDGSGFTMTGPASSTAAFDVSFDDGCFRGRLMGMFTCDDRFTGTFTGTYRGACASCTGGAPFSVQGILR